MSKKNARKQNEIHDKLLDEDIIVKAEKNNKESNPSVSFFKLQYYNPDPSSKTINSAFLLLAFISSLISGMYLPGFSFLFGQVLNKLRNDKSADFMTVMADLSIKYLILGSLLFFSSATMIFLWNYVGKQVTTNIKSQYFKSILNQEQEFFDSRNSHEFCTKVQNQIKIIETGLGQKVGQTIMSIVMCFASLGIGFTISWKLALVLTGTLPFIATAATLLATAMQSVDKRKREKYEKAGGIAEEVLYNIKTVASFCNFEFEKNRFNECLEESCKAGYSDGSRTSFAMFFIFFFLYGSYGLATWFGSLLIESKEINQITGDLFGPGDVITVIMCVVFGAFSLGNSVPNIKAVAAACEASSDFFALLERKPKIIKTDEKEIIYPTKENVKGEIEFKNVTFGYSTNKEQDNKTEIEQSLDKNKLLFDGLNFKIKAGSKIAFVGESGSGKSTIVNLIERLYEINNGEILVDGQNISKFDLETWRSLIGYVSQEPILFNTSIKDNVIFGRQNLNNDDDIKKSLDKAYASNFINSYKEKELYRAGIKGSRLSGGQKQRVAIARAILGEPRLLIFDEATSALDNKSEKIVKKALNELSSGSNTTTIIIAHRLSTVVNCDVIYVLDKGKIVEQGTHKELIELKEHYYKLVKSQLIDEEEEEEEEEGEERRNSIASKASNISDNIILDPDATLKDLTDEEKKEQDKKKTEEENIFFSNARGQLVSILKEYSGFCILAFIAALFSGSIMPVHGYLLSDVAQHLAITDTNLMKKKALETAITYVIFAFLAGCFQFILFFSFNRIGEFLTFTLRKRVFAQYLKLHIGYFDFQNNSPGALLTKLSSDTSKINGIAFSMIGSIIQSIATLTLGLAMGFYYSWQISLTCIVVIPLIALTSVAQMKVQYMNNSKEDGRDVEAGSILSECVNNTKTIFSYNFQSKATKMYDDIIEGQRTSALKTNILSSIAYGFSQFFMYASFSLLYYIGAKLLVNGYIDYNQMNKAVFGIIFGAFGIGNAQIYVGDYGKAKEALISIFRILETKSTINPYIPEKSLSKIELKGEIEFKNVNFSYPTRENFPVLKNLSFKVNPSEKIAFVGPSGSGKSSIIQLLERFYDVSEGEILIDGKNIKDYSLLDLRKNIGIVMQEPVLFKTNITENIRYGDLDANDIAVRKSAEKAYISKFFQTEQLQGSDKVNEIAFDNSMISGGEKQRVAIARAIIKNPSIMLLDEATSALDKNSEEIVQKALDEQMINRTSIVVAHRLSTIVNVDKIFVLKKGEIIEQGNHQELLERKGVYYNLYNSS